MDRGGTILKSVDIPNSQAGVAEALGRYQRPIKAVLDACYAWEPMRDWLDEFADEVVLAHPLKPSRSGSARRLHKGRKIFGQGGGQGPSSFS